MTILNYFSIGEGSSYELHHIPFAYKIDVTSQDYEEWEAYEFEFCGQVSNANVPLGCRCAVNYGSSYCDSSILCALFRQNYGTVNIPAGILAADMSLERGALWFCENAIMFAFPLTGL